MLEFAKKYGWNTYSQNGEDGIIQEVINRIGLKKGTAVEFGGADGVFCSNTAALRAVGWKVYMYDLESTNPRVEKRKITEDNVNDLPDCDLLSIDIDGNDYMVWKAYKGKPAVVIIEVNSSFPPDVYHFSLEHGCSYSLMNKLGEEKGYFLLCHTGNMVFVDNKYKDLFREVNLDPIINHSKFFNSSWLH